MYLWFISGNSAAFHVNQSPGVYTGKYIKLDVQIKLQDSAS